MLFPIRLGIAGGLVWGVTLFIMTLFGLYLGYGLQFLSVMASIYPGFEVSWMGAVIGLIYGFVDCFIGLSILAWIYNRLNIKK